MAAMAELITKQSTASCKSRPSTADLRETDKPDQNALRELAIVRVTILVIDPSQLIH